MPKITSKKSVVPSIFPNCPGYLIDGVMNPQRLSWSDKEEKIMQEAYQKTRIDYEETEARIGCLCSKGYVLANENSTECVHTSECPGREGYENNEHYKICGSACPTTCLTRDQKIACIKQCVAGCFCNDGFLLHEGECISDTMCNQVLGISQESVADVEKSEVLIVLASFLLALLLLGL